MVQPICSKKAWTDSFCEKLERTVSTVVCASDRFLSKQKSATPRTDSLGGCWRICCPIVLYSERTSSVQWTVTRWKNTYPQVLIKIYKVCKFALAELVDFVCNINNVLPTESESHPQNTVLLIALKFRQIIFNVGCKQRLNFVFLARPSSPTLLHPLIRFFFSFSRQRHNRQ